MSAERRDVVIVGAGLAGLSAASVLGRNGVEARVLEARDRVGGRTFSMQLAGEAVDLGAEHVGYKHRRMRALAKSLGIALRPSGMLTAKSRWELGGADKVSHIPPVPAGELASSVRVMARLARLARRLPVNEPWNAPSAPTLDRMSLADWLDREGVSGRIRDVHNALWQDGFSVEIESISMLHLLWGARRSGGVLSAIRDTVGLHVEGGTQAVALGLARGLGDRVQTGSPVVRIEQDDREVNVVMSDGTSVQAARAIVCVPVPTLGSIEFSPSLPDELEILHRELKFGRATTIIVGSPDAPDPGFIMAAGNPDFGMAWRRGPTAKAKIVDLDPAATARVADEVARKTKVPSAGRVMETIAWPQEPFSRGTYVNFSPGQLSRLGPSLNRSHGRIQFAAAERSTWSTFMEGAVESGQRAAAELLASLRKQSVNPELVRA